LINVTHRGAAATIGRMESLASPSLVPSEVQHGQKFTTAFSLVFGMVLTLAVSGYQFGRGNLTVYLLDGLRAVHPELLRNDWFVTQTLQYHACFSLLTECLVRLHILQPGFLIGYLLLIVFWHLFWRRLVISIGGDDRTYLVSVFLFYLSAAGISLGVFQFLQDGCFLPSNVANVAMLGGIASWVGGRRVTAGVWFGIAGLFHVNYAAVGIGLWLSLLGWEWLDRWPTGPMQRLFPEILSGTATAAQPRPDLNIASNRTLLASFLMLAPSLVNLCMTLPNELRRGGTMPMAEFVAVYVRFRHEHHYDPVHWPAILWLSFLWPIPLAVWAAARWEAFSDFQYARRETCRTFTLIFGLLVIAFLFAGVWFINEPLVQLCFWRFGIYIKLMSCIGAAFILCDARLLRWSTVSRTLCGVAVIAAVAYTLFWAAGPTGHGPVWSLAYSHRVGIGLVIALWIVLAVEESLSNGSLFRRIAIGVLPIAALVAWPALGVGMTPEPDDANYREVCRWAKDPAHTSINAVFLVPPQETDFRLYAERAIVINFKHVPQLSGEIIEWQKRLLDVLGVPDVSGFPRGYEQTLAAIESLYEHRTAAELFAVASKYHARYVVVDHSLGKQFDRGIVFHHENNPYFVYDLMGFESNQT
jgi:hypothetical protein